ncbi:MAG: DNA repair protein RecN [Spirochaetaceae bacterium]|jgi:DNA repair protein RecN (Recombination protein N)|nr:DNA repair protein RecN [Spirochaetaceae bacterium]
MLEDLTISDFALIDKASLEFLPGFNILSGETGAGKSILIGALSFLLGGKADPDVIRTGAAETRVSGVFTVSPGQGDALGWLADHGITPENGRVLLRRVLRDNGRSAAWIQDAQVTRGELAEFTASLVDIHGQHEHQSLMRVGEHRRFLDSFAGITGEVASFTVLYAKLVERRRRLDDINASEMQRAQKTELLTFAAEEIASAELRSGEEEELSAEETRLEQHEKLWENIDSLGTLIGGEILSALRKARSTLEYSSAIDGTLSPLLARFEDAYYEIEDIAGEVRSYRDGLVFDPARLEEIQERLALIFRLKKKYGESIPGILEYYENAQAQLEQLADSEGNRELLSAEIGALEKELYQLGCGISAGRREAASRMAEQVEGILAELGMAGTRFSVDLSVKEGEIEDLQRCGPYGFDNIEFLISANPGSPLRPLAKIASGGELSRVMLALKTVLADTDGADTLVFDEIDTGIGGEVSVAVGRHLKNLAKHKQILCITHLANIAVYADNHMRIEKVVDAEKTKTRVYPVTSAARIQEVARMLSGDTIGDASLKHAQAMLEKYGGTS